ncbi:MAG: helix-turn-helix transcriptional regulator [Oscillospiraceae bacterium]|nr:helix-turn-helix transcriptional regulator [Oscillospiraceae bacterium]
MIVYDRLWKTMKQKGISQYKLLKVYGFSSGQLDRIRKGESITMYTLNSLCEILNCRVEDIIEYRPDK